LNYSKPSARIVSTLVMLLCVIPSLAVADTPSSAPDFSGQWLVDQTPTMPRRTIYSTVDVQGSHFSLHRFWNLKADWTGSFELGNGGNLELQSDGFSFKETGGATEYLPCHLHGIYRLDGNRLTICVARTEADSRPVDFKESPNAYLLSFVRTSADWHGFPKTVKINVLDPSGKPDPKGVLFGYLNRSRPGRQHSDGKYYIDTTQPAVLTSSASLRGDQEENLDAQASLQVPYSRFDDQVLPQGAMDKAADWIGIEPVSPALLASGTLTIHMHPLRIVRGKIAVSGELPAGQPAPWRAAAVVAFGSSVAWCEAPDGAVEFCLPPGTYSLHAYGSDLLYQDSKFAVPEGYGDFTLPTITLQPSNIIKLVGKPAPELVMVKGWKNSPATIAGCKGKVILLDFWGYWCGNCVYDMPNVIALYEKYHDKGLEVISVHVDMAGEIDTADKLDARIRKFRDGIWKGKDLPFPVALCSAKDHGNSGNPEHYGVMYYPTAVFIDRAGNVLGTTSQQLPFDLSDMKQAEAGIEKLLAAQTR